MKRNVKIAPIALVFALFFAMMPNKASADSWGLSFQTPGQVPIGNATAEELREHDAFFTGNINEKTIYLTFDAGFENGNTEPILDILQKHNVPAAFFLVGTYVRDNPDIIRRMVEEGHLIGNHTMNHPNMATITDRAKFQAELEEVEQHYKEVTGQDMPKFYRPPEGVYSVDNLKLAKELGYTTLFWSLAYVDWYVHDQPTAEEAFDKLIPRIHPGAILMLHNTSTTNAEILDQLIEEYHEMGYVFGGVDQLMADSE